MTNCKVRTFLLHHPVLFPSYKGHQTSLPRSPGDTGIYPHSQMPKCPPGSQTSEGPASAARGTSALALETQEPGLQGPSSAADLLCDGGLTKSPLWRCPCLPLSTCRSWFLAPRGLCQPECLQFLGRRVMSWCPLDRSFAKLRVWHAIFACSVRG